MISAGAAYFTRARADQTWLKAHALPFPKPTTRQMIAFILIILLVIALAVGIGMLSSAGFYAP